MSRARAPSPGPPTITAPAARVDAALTPHNTAVSLQAADHVSFIPALEGTKVMNDG